MRTHAHTRGINTDVDASTLLGKQAHKRASRCTRRGFMTSAGVLKVFLSLCHVLNFLLAPITNLPPAHNRIISCVSISLLAYLNLFPLAFLLCLSASYFYCVSLSLSLSPSLSLFSSSCLFGMNSSLHCRMAGCYDSRLLLTVFGLGGQGRTHTCRRPAMHTHTQGHWHLHLSELPSHTVAARTLVSGIGFSRWSSSSPGPAAVFWVFTQNFSISGHC